MKQKNVDYQEGQVASESIRANKTIENTAATEQKRKLAAEAVTPEYTYQEDLANTQHDRISQLFTLIRQVKTNLTEDYEKAQKDAKEGTTIPKPTVDEHVAALKKNLKN